MRLKEEEGLAPPPCFLAVPLRVTLAVAHCLSCSSWCTSSVSNRHAELAYPLSEGWAAAARAGPSLRGPRPSSVELLL